MLWFFGELKMRLAIKKDRRFERMMSRTKPICLHLYRSKKWRQISNWKTNYAVHSNPMKTNRQHYTRTIFELLKRSIFFPFRGSFRPLVVTFKKIAIFDTVNMIIQHFEEVTKRNLPPEKYEWWLLSQKKNVVKCKITVTAPITGWVCGALYIVWSWTTKSIFAAVPNSGES